MERTKGTPVYARATAACDDVRVVSYAVKAGNALVAGKEAYATALAI